MARSALWAFLGLVAFIVIFNFLLPNIGDNLNEGGLIALGLIFSLVPALLWLSSSIAWTSVSPNQSRWCLSSTWSALILAAALYPTIVHGPLPGRSLDVHNLVGPTVG